MRPFGCPLTILNTLDSLGKFDRKSDEGYLLGYSTSRTGPNWMFDLDFLTNSMNYILVSVENQVNVDVGQAFEEEKRRITSQKKAFVSTDRSFVSTDRSNTPNVSAASTSTGANTNESSFVYLGGKIPIDASTLPNADLPIDPNMPDLEDASETLLNDGIFNEAYDDNEDVDAVADINNMDNTIVFKQEERFTRLLQSNKLWLFLAFASYMGFLVYQMDAKSSFLYGKIEEEVYVHQPPGFVDPAHPNKVYKVVKALYGLHQAPRAWYETLFSFLLKNGFRRVMHKRFQMSSMGELTFFLGLQVKQQPDGIFISQDKYVVDILKKFELCFIKTATTPIESNKPLVKDEDDVEPRLGLWYPRDSPFELEAFSDSDYVGASLDRKSTTSGCQFLGRRLISWQCKKQTIVANSTTEAEYVAATYCCGQVL
ncbi:putative ribonuclease H-like domain-containing protein [Tanacetum coccineum]